MGVIDESAVGRPHPALRPFVDSYHGYRQAGVGPALHRGLPSPFMTMIVTLDDPLVMARHPLPEQPASRHDTLVGGLHAAPALISHDGRQSGIQLSLRPVAARALLGVPAGELAHIDLHGDEVLGPVAAELRERCLAAATWELRWAAVDAVLLRLLRPVGLSPAMRAWDAIVSNRGRLRVPEVAAGVGLSERQLRTRMHAEVGLGPKAAARVVRFDHARRALGRRSAAGRPLDLAGLAAAAGYADQAHMAREWRQLAGCAPSTWVVEEHRNVQAGVTSDTAWWEP